MIEKPNDRILTREFMLLNLVVFLGFSNLALLFQLYDYLHTLPIDPKAFGLLISVFSFTALILRPVISPFLHPGNARLWMALGAAGSMIALFAYSLARTFTPLLLVRILHGAGFVTLASAMMAMVVCFIPAQRSGQAFGLISVSTLLPYAVLPPLLDPVLQALGTFDRVLGAGGLLMVLVFPCILGVKPPSLSSAESGAPGLSRSGLRENFQETRIPLLLAITLLFFTGYTMIFFFLRGFGTRIGIANPGLFYTIATAAMIALRLFVGALFDRMNKVRLLGVMLLLVAGGYGVLPFVRGALPFFGLACLLGVGWGAAMPLMNALIFDASLPRFKGLNLNMAIWMIDGGFVLGPLAGNLVLAGAEDRYGLLYGVCAALMVVAFGMLGGVKRPGSRVRGS
ncbi:MAG: MFS transporter [Desulfobacteraceae bacterium]|jgi:predicted MFS family arabinose efflux permease